MKPPTDWALDFFIDKGRLFGEVMRAGREQGIEEARLIAGLLEKHGVPRGSHVIELGCGIGRVAVPLAREGYRVDCIDISPEYIREALEYARIAGVEGLFEGIVGDAWRIDEIVDRKYSAALMVWTTLIGYRGSPESDVELLSRIRRIVKLRGKLFILRHMNRDLVAARSVYCGADAVVKEAGDLVVIERPEFDPIKSVLENTWTYYRRRGDELKFLGKAKLKLKLYTITELTGIASNAGWELEALYGSLRGDPFIPGRSHVNAVFKRAETNI